MSPYITPDQLVERWAGQITRDTLANWRSQTIGPPYVKVGNRILYPLDEVIKWEQQRMLK